MAPMATSEKGHKKIKRICCIGAGYVVSRPFTSILIQLPRPFAHSPRTGRTNMRRHRQQSPKHTGRRRRSE